PAAVILVDERIVVAVRRLIDFSSKWQSRENCWDT
ncbi:hypothetical protein P3T33_004012, partial [Rhizobium sp. AN67]|nr:hypothetical protein [Rhizobium sp. AN67]